MLSRRDVLATAATGAGLALAAPVSEPASAQPARRIIVDAQVHIWLANSPERPWPPDAIGQAHLPAAILLLRAADADGRGRRRPGRDRAAVLGGLSQRI